MTTTDFAPITLNGEPLVTWRNYTDVEIDGRLYYAEPAASQDCTCRRCMLHDDFGGCIVAEAQWGLCLLLSDPFGAAPIDWESWAAAGTYESS